MLGVSSWCWEGVGVFSVRSNDQIKIFGGKIHPGFGNQPVLTWKMTIPGRRSLFLDPRDTAIPTTMGDLKNDLYISIHIYTYLCISMHIYAYLSIYPSIHLSIYLSIYLSISIY